MWKFRLCHGNMPNFSASFEPEDIFYFLAVDEKEDFGNGIWVIYALLPNGV